MAKVNQARHVLASGVRADPALTVGRFLTDWLTVVVAARADSPNTVTNCATVIRVHLIPALGRRKLSELTPDHADAMLRAKPNRGLSKSCVARMRSVLADARTHAERRSLVLRNGGRLAVMPRSNRHESCEPSPPKEVRAFVIAAQDHRLRAMLIVVTIGLRPGEGLQARRRDQRAEGRSLCR
jgi:integrase